MRAKATTYKSSVGRKKVVTIDCELMVQHNSCFALKARFRREKDAYGLQPAEQHLQRGQTL